VTVETFVLFPSLCSGPLTVYYLIPVPRAVRNFYLIPLPCAVRNFYLIPLPCAVRNFYF